MLTISAFRARQRADGFADETGQWNVE